MKKIKLLFFVAVVAGFLGCTKDQTTPTPPTKQFTVTATSSAGGTISPAGTHKFNVGDAAPFQLIADAGHTLAKLTVDGNKVSPNYTKTGGLSYTMYSDGALDARWGYGIHVTAGLHGTVVPSDTAAESGKGVTLTFNPDKDYHTDTLWVGKVGEVAHSILLDGKTSFTINLDTNYAARVSFVYGWSSQELVGNYKILAYAAAKDSGDWHYVKEEESLDSTRQLAVNAVVIPQSVLVDDYEHFSADGTYYSYVGASGGSHPIDLVANYSLTTDKKMVLSSNGSVLGIATIYDIGPTSFVIGFHVAGNGYHWRYYEKGVPGH